MVRLWEATGGGVSALRVDRLPICSTSLWTRPAVPDPDDVPLRLHFDVKATLGFEHAVISRYRIAVVRRSRVGDWIGHHQVLRSVGPERSTALGWGRSWEIDHVLIDADGSVLQTETFTAVGYQPGQGSTRPVRRSRVTDVSSPSAAARPSAGAGPGGGRRGVVGVSPTIGSLSRAAAACRVWAAVHHDPVAARRAGLPGVIACTQHLAALLEQAGLAERAESNAQAGLDLRMHSPMFATRFV